MEAYLIKNDIEYDYANETYIVPNFTYFHDIDINITYVYHKHLTGKNTIFNELLDRIRQNNYKYALAIKVNRRDCITYIYCRFYINDLFLTCNIYSGHNFDFIVNCYNYIINNLNYTTIKNIDCDYVTIQIGNFVIKLYGLIINIFYMGNFEKRLTDFDKFINYVQKNMSEHFINHDIKIALKN